MSKKQLLACLFLPPLIVFFGLCVFFGEDSSEKSETPSEQLIQGIHVESLESTEEDSEMLPQSRPNEFEQFEKSESYFVTDMQDGSISPGVSMSEMFSPDIISLDPHTHKTVSLMFEQRGTLTEMNVDRGEVVNAGTVLCRQRIASLEGELKSIKAKILIAEKNSKNDAPLRAALEQSKYDESEKEKIIKLYKLYAASGSEVARKQLEAILSGYAIENAEVQMAIAKLSIDVLQGEKEKVEAEIQKRTLYAPFAGEVWKVGVGLGSTVEDEEVIRLVNLEEFIVDVLFQDDDLNTYTWWRNANVYLENTVSGERIQGRFHFANDSDVGVGKAVTYAFTNEKDGPYWKWVPSDVNNYKVILEKRKEGGSEFASKR